MKLSTRVALVAAGAVLVGGAYTGGALAAAPAPATPATPAITQADVDDAFDRGMKAGQEYEAWFCTEKESAAS